jgi:ABC-2 type transport system permease protein
MTTIILWLLDRLKPLFQTMGADYGQLRAIVQVKLTMDNRRNSITLGRYGKSSGESTNTFTRILAIYAFIGGLISLGMLATPDKDRLFFPLTLQFSYIMALCAMTLISDFSSVILDSSDNQIILPRPVSSRTLWLARVVHITSYLFAIALSLSVVAILFIAYRFGAIAGLLFLVMSLLSAVLMVFLTNIFYLLLMRFISEEKLREVINYFQIVMAVLFYGGYQFLPRLIDTEALTQTFAIQWWHYLVPPMWMAGTIEIIIQPILDSTHLVFAVLAIVTPILGLWFMNRFLTTNFTQKLGSMDQESQPVQLAASTQTIQPGRVAWVDKLSAWFTDNALERAAFAFTWRITGRDRKFKLKTYPQLGFGLAYVIVMSLQGSSFGSSGFFYLFALYFAGLYVMVARYQLSVSDNYRASWIYGSAPIQTPGDVLSGSLKALIIKLLLPFYSLLASYILYRYSIDKISDVLLAFSNSLVMLISAALLSSRYMPFSTAHDALKQSNTARGLLTSLVLGLVGFSHYGLTYIPYGTWIALPLSMLTFWILLRYYRQTDWSQIMMG